MTVLIDPITFNTGTGSDTSASGSANSGVALFGAAASTNNTTAVDVSGDAVDLTPVLAGDLLWVDSTAGRQYSVIVSRVVGTSIITCDDVFSQTEGSRQWGIGDKRATFDHADSRTVFADFKGDWVVETETDQTITGSSIAMSGDGATLVIKSDGTTIRTLTSTMNDAHFDGAGEPMFDTLKFESTNATRTACSAMDGAAWATFINCILGDATNKLTTGCEAAKGFFVNCEITSCTGDGTSVPWIHAYACWVHDNTGSGIDNNADAAIIIDCVIVDNAIGLELRGDSIVSGCVIASNTGDGITTTTNTNFTYQFINNQITHNGGWGIDMIANDQPNTIILNNNFGTGASANTLGDISTNIHANATVVGNVATDPAYTAGADNWETGANFTDAGYPLKTTTIGANQSATNLFTSIGIEQEHTAGGGGGSPNLLKGTFG